MLNFTYILENSVAQVDRNDIAPYLNPDLTKIIGAIEAWGFDVRIVGGAVRDILTGRKPRDIDLVTNALPDEIIYILSSLKIDSDPWGVKHGTIKAIVGDEKYEITSLDYTIGVQDGKIVVNNGGDWSSDAQRRDFTMNALYMDLDGKIYDYVGGLGDIKNQILRPIPDFESKVINDPILILRFFKFLSKFPGIQFSKKTLDVIKRHIGMIDSIDDERVAKEISNVEGGPDSSNVLAMMRKLGVDLDHYKGILTESRADYVKKNLGSKLLDQLQKDPDVDIFELDDQPQINLDSLMAYLTDNGKMDKFINWIANQYLKNKFRLEDVPKLHDDLKLFDRFKNTLPVRDINQVKTVNDLYDMVKDLGTAKTRGEESREKDALMHQQAKVLWNDDQYKITIPETQEASCYFGRNTRWCTAAEKGNMFNRYHKDGPLIIILDKKRNRRWQFHFESGSFMNEDDREIDLLTFAQDHPRAWGVVLAFGRHNGRNFITNLIEADPDYYKLIPDPSERESLEMVQTNPDILKDPKFRTPELINAALKKSGYALQYIKEPTSEQILLASRTNPNVVDTLEYDQIEKFDEDFIIKLLANGAKLHHFSDEAQRNPKLRIAALRNSVQNLSYMVEPLTDEEARTAIETDPSSIILINRYHRDHLWPWMIDMAIMKNPIVIHAVKNEIVDRGNFDYKPSEEVIDHVLRHSLENAIEISEYMTDEQLRYVIEKNPVYFSRMAKHNPALLKRDDLVKFAIDQDYSMIYVVKNPSVELQKYAVNINPRAVYQIKDPDPEVVKLAARLNQERKTDDKQLGKYDVEF